MEPWVKALINSAGGGLVLATLAVGMGLRRLEALRGVRFSRRQRWQAWWTIFFLFTAFGFFAQSLAQP